MESPRTSLSQVGGAKREPKRHIRVFVVSHVRVHREGLELLLADTDVEVVGAAAPGPGTLARIRGLLPELVLLDLPAATRFSEVRAIRRAAPRVKLVAVGVSETEDEIVRCAEAGICGYVVAEASCSELAATLASVVRGELPCSPRIAAALMLRLGSVASGSPPASPLSQLTYREREIAELVAQGLSNKEIARRLVIEVATVKTHVHRVLVKLGLEHRDELAGLTRGVGRAV